MEDLITIVIIVIGVAIKLFGAWKKHQPEQEADDASEMSWDEFLEEVDKNPELREVVSSDPDLQKGYQEAKLQQQMHAEQLKADQAEKDAALLEQQRILAEMALKAQAANELSAAGEISAIYTQIDSENNSESENSSAEWADLIRNNRTEAVVISEILAKPIALR